MNGSVPHIVQYQGSKRLLAPQILNHMPKRFNRLVEPFAGMAAITIAAAKDNRAMEYHINDINEPIVELLRAAINTPNELAKEYADVWGAQFKFPGGHLEHFYYIRERFNTGEQSTGNMLYLLARCVKGAVRYGKGGNFNQSPDKRRHGVNPQKVSENVNSISRLLKGRVTFSAIDYRQVFELLEPGDLVYMDPPYQGVSDTRDHRYCGGVDFEEFSTSIAELNRRGVYYVISYDGECGGKEYGNILPKGLCCTRFLLNAGISSQATLLGRRSTTFEALYVSENISRSAESLAHRNKVEV